MYYKLKIDSEIVDVLEELQYVFYSPKSKDILFCRKESEAYGVISGNGQGIWHVDGWTEFPESVQKRILGTVTIEEIDEDEYQTLKELLDAGEQPEDPEPEPEPEPETDAETLAWAKKKKIELSKTMLAEYLEQHPITSTAHGGVEGTYAVTEEKQQLMALNYNTYQIKKAAGLEAVLTWNETGEECEVWTEAEFVQLVIEIEAYVKPLVSLQQAFEKAIQTAETLKEVDKVEIIY